MILPTIDQSAFDKMMFCHPWRNYQTRFLADLDHYLKDDRIHLVAPPGAGKTVLGLEIVRRIGRPALVLVPSLTIREQWTQRLRADFLSDEVRPAWISHDLRKPALITIVTYQALYQLAEKEPASIGQLSCIETLVTDECHHLRREWWRVLQNFRMRHDPILVALTATPPYDVNSVEWRRYHSFCGEIDAEISIPELVAAGDLCPHQDYVWPVLPSLDEQEAWQQFQVQRSDFMEELEESRSLALELLGHPYLQDPEEHWDQIYEEPAYFTALLIVLRLLGSEPPVAALGVLHDEQTDIPPCTWDWLNIFFQTALYKDPFLMKGQAKEILTPFKRKLQRIGALDKQRVELNEPIELAKKLASSKAKMDGVLDILALEHESMELDLRMVILTDFIRPEVLPTTEHDLPELDRLGAVPIFEMIRRSKLDLPLPCLLTGSLVILPETVIERLEAIADKELSKSAKIRSKTLIGAPLFRIIECNPQSAKRLVRWITQLFGEGHLQLIIGTKSLLGEGWDAPQINTLILANTVGSYVLSNQMRGRAIRSQKAFPEATANIWHLFTYQAFAEDGGADLNKLKRRFRAFAGPTLVGPANILNNLERFPRKLSDLKMEEVIPFRENMRLYARSRAGLARRWQDALIKGNELVEAIQPPDIYQKREDRLSRYYHQNLVRSLPQTIREIQQQQWIGIWVGLVASIGLAYFGSPSITIVAILALGLCGLALWKRKLLVNQASMLYRSEKWGQYVKQSLFPFGIAGVLTWLLFLWQPSYGLIFLFIFIGVSSGMILQYGKQTAIRAWQYFSALADTRSFVENTALAIVRALIKTNQLTPTQEAHLRVEEGTEGLPVCYLANTNRYQAELFSEAMRELLSPIENPRYLLALRLNGQEEEAFYFPVPHTLARKKTDAEQLRNELASHWDQVDLVYTRTPLGRRILLKNRLAWSNLNGDQMPKKERIWR